MITETTVFILGAGASSPYGYPTGAGLKDMICYELRDLLDLLIPRSGIDSSFEVDHKENIEENSVEFVKQFCNSPIELIDSFLERRRDISEEGRGLISLCILNAEKNSVFYREIEESKRQYDWYSFLFNIMVKELRNPDSYLDFKKNRVTFITFNYDRSLEHFLYDKLNTTFKIDAKCKPLDLIPFNFIHVYGKIDNLEWEDPPGLEYKREYYIRDVLKTAENIKLIHERDDAFLNEIKKVIADAKNIFFLGFGYDEYNMMALGWPEGFNEEKSIFGTAFNLTENRITEIRTMIQKGFKNPDLTLKNPVIKPIDCRSLLDEFKNYLLRHDRYLI